MTHADVASLETCQSFNGIVEAAVLGGNIAAAVGVCETRLAEASDDALAWRHLGVLKAIQGVRGDAIRAGRRACELLPEVGASWQAMGRIHVLLGEMGEAIMCFQQVVDIDVGDADGWHNLGTALKHVGRDAPAFQALKNALLIDSGRADTYLNLAALLVSAGQYEDAAQALERAVDSDPTLPESRSRLANRWLEEGKVRRAETLFRQSLAMDGNHIDGWLGLARTLEDMGERDGAQSAYRNILRIRLDHAQALGNHIALLKSAEGEDAEFVAYAERTLRNECVRDEARALIGYGLAKFHDRAGRFDEAAQCGLIANAARRRCAGPLDRAALEARVNSIIKTYDRDFFSTRRRFGLGTDQPVFIVGLPRSGTTLTEQVLAAHSRMHGAGELPDLARLADKAAGSELLWQGCKQLKEVTSRKFAQEYLTKLRDGAPKKRLRISDKQPLNFFQLAFAALLFPSARVIHCRRDPRDNALSIWMENFNPDQRYATDFGDLAFFTGMQDRLMAHWREVLPLDIHDMPYEATVAEPEARVRGLIDFLKVPWEDSCLNFHASDRAIQTPSRWQVRQPIYSGSVGRWRNYERSLPDLVTAFGAAG